MSTFKTGFSVKMGNTEIGKYLSGVSDNPIGMIFIKPSERVCLLLTKEVCMDLLVRSHIAADLVCNLYCYGAPDTPASLGRV